MEKIKHKKHSERVLSKELLFVGIGRRSVGLTWYLFNLVEEKKKSTREGGGLREGSEEERAHVGWVQVGEI